MNEKDDMSISPQQKVLKMDFKELAQKYQYKTLDNDSKKLPPKNMELILLQLKGSAREQNDAINLLRVYTTKGFVRPSYMPKDFVSEYVSLFTNNRTDFYIRVALLSLSNDIMKYCTEYIEEFGRELFYSKVFEEMIRGRNFRVEQCLPVLSHFILHYCIAFSYLNKRGFLKFILDKIESENNKSAQYSLYAALEDFTSSIYFSSIANKDTILHICDICVKKIIPVEKTETYIDLDTLIFYPVVKTLSNLILHIPPSYTQFMDMIVSYGVCPYILSIINEENMKLSICGTEFLCCATYNSDIVCIQLQKMEAVDLLSSHLLNRQFYANCAAKCLRIFYNIFVACLNSNDESQSYIYKCAKDEPFKNLLNYVINEGHACEKSEVISIFSAILYSMEKIPDEAIAFANNFKTYDFIQIMLEMDSSTSDTQNILIMALILGRIHDLSLYYGEQLSEFREIMESEEVSESLQRMNSQKNNPQFNAYLRDLLKWIEDHKVNNQNDDMNF